ncbi:hypothetical protein CCE01nite_09390 [Cellulomonas cellasea]|nr:hypothetical protein CCE01nite_09390 [Cellulomonas cellasea]
MARHGTSADDGIDLVREGPGTAGRTTMSDAPQDPDAGTQESGYGYPTLEQEVTPEVLEGGAASEGSGGSPEAGAGSAEDSDDHAPTPGELVEDPSAVEPTD